MSSVKTKSKSINPNPTKRIQRKNGHAKGAGIGDNSIGALDPVVQEYVVKITACWRDAVASIIETGKMLIEAKDKLPHGKFGEMFQTKERKGPDVLPFSARMGQMLMTIARHPVLSNPKNFSHLPASWATLHGIAEIAFPPGALQDLIDSGVIHAETPYKEGRDFGYKLIEHYAAALHMLIKFMGNWQPDKLAATLSLYVPPTWRMDDKEDLAALGELLPWLTQFHTECMKIRHETNQAREREALVIFPPPIGGEDRAA